VTVQQTKTATTSGVLYGMIVPPQIFTSVKKPHLYENMSKFNANPWNLQNTKFLSGYALGDHAETAETGSRHIHVHEATIGLDSKRPKGKFQNFNEYQVNFCIAYLNLST